MSRGVGTQGTSRYLETLESKHRDTKRREQREKRTKTKRCTFFGGKPRGGQTVGVEPPGMAGNDKCIE